MPSFELLERRAAKTVVGAVDAPERFGGALTMVEERVIEIEENRPDHRACPINPGCTF